MRLHLPAKISRDEQISDVNVAENGIGRDENEGSISYKSFGKGLDCEDCCQNKIETELKKAKYSSGVLNWMMVMKSMKSTVGTNRFNGMACRQVVNRIENWNGKGVGHSINMRKEK